MPLPIALDYRPALLSSAGIGRVTRELAAALSLRGELELHLFGHSLARARVAHALPRTALLHRLPIPGRTLPTLARLGLAADRLCGSPRVFHCTDYVELPVRRARVVLTVHDLAFAHDASFHGEAQAAQLLARTRTAAAAAAAVVVPSRTTADDVQRLTPARRVVVVPFGSEHAQRSDRAHPFGGRDYVLCVGTLEPRKNHRALLQAFRQLRQPRPLLVLVGNVGWRCDEIVRDVDAAERDGLVHWQRGADDGALWRLLQHARLLAYPSAFEGFGLPPLEAMALGVPVLAGDTPALRELGDDAMLYATGNDPAALAAALDELLHDAQLATRLRSAGPQRAANFRWRDCAAAHAQLYAEVAT